MTNDELKKDMDFQDVDEDKYLIYQLGEEIYGSPLIHIKEIIKMQSIKPVPFMIDYFCGILNLRGQIISVIDLRKKLSLSFETKKESLLIVVESSHGLIASVVDNVLSVTKIEKNDITSDLNLKTKVPVDYFIGVSHFGKDLVNIIDIKGTLTAEDLAIIQETSQELK